MPMPTQPHRPHTFRRFLQFSQFSCWQPPTAWLRSWRVVLLLAVLPLVLVTACSQSQGRQRGSSQQGGTDGFQRNAAAAEASPEPQEAQGPRTSPPSPVAVVASPSPAPGVLSMPLRSGEYAVTANRDDHSLSVVPIGLAAVALTVPVDGTPLGVATVNAPDRAFVIAAGPTGQVIDVINLDARALLGSLDLG